MIKGVGIDIVNVNRVKAQLALKILAPNELDKYNSLSPQRQKEFLASRFAAKEAYLKSQAKGIGDINLCEIEIANLPSGAPYYVNDAKVMLSISHEKDTAVAVAIALV